MLSKRLCHLHQRQPKPAMLPSVWYEPVALQLYPPSQRPGSLYQPPQIALVLCMPISMPMLMYIGFTPTSS